MSAPYILPDEESHNKGLADLINAFWATRGKKANARATKLIVGGGRQSRKYWTVVSSVDGSWVG